MRRLKDKPNKPAAVEKPTTAVARPQAGGWIDTVGSPDSAEMAFPDSEPKPSIPYVGFWHENKKDAEDIVSALGAMTVGQPYIKLDSDYHRAGPLAWTIIKAKPYWASFDKSNKIIDCFVEPQEWDFDFAGRRVKHNFLTLMLVLPGAKPLPEEFGPALTTVTDCRKTARFCIEGHTEKVNATASDAWLKKNGEVAGRTPILFRLTSEFRVEPRSFVKDGETFTYAMIKAKSQTITVPQFEAIARWGASEECKEDYLAAEEYFDKRWAFIVSDAEKTAEKPEAKAIQAEALAKAAKELAEATKDA